MNIKSITGRMLFYVPAGALLLLVFAFSPFRLDPLFSIKEDLFAVVSGAIFLLSMLFFKRERLRFPLPAMCFFLFVLLSWLSLIWAVNPHETVRESSRWTYAFLLFYASYTLFDQRSMRVLISGGIFAGVVTAFFGIAEYFDYPLLFAEKGKILSFFGHQNMLGQFLAVTLVWTWAVFLKTPRWRWVYIPAMAVIGFGLFVTNCRSGYVSALAGMLAVALIIMRGTSVKSLWRIVKPAVIIGALCVAAFAVIDIKINYVDSDKYRDFHTYIVKTYFGTFEYGVLSGRSTLWKYTCKMIGNRPLLGFGAGNHWIGYPSVDPPQFIEFSKQAHNDYLQIASDVGIIGFGLFIAFLLFALVPIIKHKPAEKDTLIYSALVSGIIVILIDSFFSYDLFVPVPTYMLMVSLGYLLSLNNPGGQLTQYRPTIRGVAIVIGFAVFVFAVYTTIVRSIGYYDYLAGSIIVSANEGVMPPDENRRASAFVEKARKYLPYDAEVLFFDMMLDVDYGDFFTARRKGYALLELTPYEKKLILFIAKLEATLGNTGACKDLLARLNVTGSDNPNRFISYLLSDYDTFESTITAPQMTQDRAKLFLNQLNKTIEEQEKPDVLALFLRAILLTKTGQWQKALNDLNIVMERDPSNTQVYLLRGICYNNIGRFALAQNEFQSYILFDPHSEQALLGSAVAYQMMGDDSRAEEQLRTILSINPQNAKALRNIGLIMLKRNEQETGVDYLQQSLIADPAQPDADQIRAVIQSILNEPRN
ncbi:MAG: O-antigen ligase family protein [Candidatus Auribacterota bacterium]